MKIDSNIFNRSFKETMDFYGLSGKRIAELTGKTQENISNIRGGKSYPTLQTFAEMMAAAESECPGFFEDFTRRLTGQSRRVTMSPQEYVNACDSSELSALLYAVGNRVDASGRSVNAA